MRTFRLVKSGQPQEEPEGAAFDAATVLAEGVEWSNGEVTMACFPLEKGTHHYVSLGDVQERYCDTGVAQIKMTCEDCDPAEA